MLERLATIAKGPGDLVQRKELVEENAERHRSPSTCVERRDGVALLSRLERGSSSIELCAWHPPPLLSVARERLRALLASFWHQGMLSL